MWLESGVIDQRVPFYTGATGLASGSTVRRQRGTNASAAMTTPDIVEDATVVGLYRLLLDEDTTITTGKTTEIMTLIITNSTLNGVSLAIAVQLYDALSVDVAKMNGTPLLGSGTSGDHWRGE